MPRKKKETLPVPSKEKKSLTPVERKLRNRRAMDMVVEGNDWQTIAETLGFKNAQTARASVKKYVDSYVWESTDEMRRHESLRLSEMWNIVWPLIKKGSLPAVDRGLAIMARRAKLLGLDAPEEKVQWHPEQVVSALTPQQREQAVLSILARAAGPDNDQIKQIGSEAILGKNAQLVERSDREDSRGKESSNGYTMVEPYLDYDEDGDGT